MINYAVLYERLVARTLANAQIDLETFLEDALDQGMSLDSVVERLIDDLENDGPLFGKFFNSLVGAGEQAAVQAHRQAFTVAQAADELAELRGMTDEAIDALLDDPEALTRAEVDADAVAYTWVAELVNTCHRCLPLHNKTYPLGTWRELGFHPSTIHSGWNSVCHCSLVMASSDAAQEVAPLHRTSVEKKRGAKGNRRTARALGSVSVDTALNARNRALESDEGRRVLRLLGSVNA